MESYLVCENCKKLFNLSNRKPIIFIECLDTVCLECVVSVVLKNQISENQFKCCLNEDHIVNIDKENLDDLKINTTIMRNLQSQKNLPIFCEVHKNTVAQLLIQNENKLICEICLIQHQHENGENQVVREINKVGMKRYASQSIELLEKGVNQLYGQLNKMRKLQEDGLNLNAIEAIDLLSSNKRLFQIIEGDKVEPQLIQSKLIKENFKLYPDQNQPQEVLNEDLDYQRNAVLYNINQNLSIIEIQQKFLSNFNKKVKTQVSKKVSFLKGILNNWESRTLNLLFKGSLDGFQPSIFHEKCDCKGPTIAYLLSEHGQIFGYYTSIVMRDFQDNKHAYDSEFFMFQLDKLTIHRQKSSIMIKIDSQSTYIKFGEQKQSSYSNNQLIQPGFQFIQKDASPIMDTTNFKNLFEIPNFQNDYSSQSYLGGSVQFKVLEMEVYSFI